MPGVESDKKKKAMVRRKDTPVPQEAQVSGRNAASATPTSRRIDTSRGMTKRLPIEYGSINEAMVSASGSGVLEFSRGRHHSDLGAISIGGASVASSLAPSESDLRASAAMSRYKYYSRIAPGASSRFIMPSHVVPPQFLMWLPFQSAHNQSSIITIFSIWNTMMGTSLLSIPWAIKEAGFATSFIVLFFMTALTFYTAYLVLESYTELVNRGIHVTEFSDVCRFYFGQIGEIVAVFFAGVALLGAVIVYWVLLSNFLYQTGRFVYNNVYNESAADGTQTVYEIGNRSYHVMCPGSALSVTVNESAATASGNASQAIFPQIWDKTDTVPFYLLLLLFPLVSIKSPSFFSKFNALGTVSVAYILFFVCVKSASWGLHLNFFSDHPFHRIQQFSFNLFSFTGILSVALFCHCFLIVLIKPAKNPKNNPRDLLIAYVCVSLTYLIVGILFYSSFPLAKSCIQQNFLDNIPSEDALGFTARVMLFIQMITVFPLLMYILRAQMMHYFFKSVYPSWLHVLLLHIAIIAAAVLVAHFYPNVGNILRLSGAICGLAYIFTLPSLVYLVSQRRSRKLTPFKLIAHSLIIAAGAVNFVAQFLFF